MKRINIQEKWFRSDILSHRTGYPLEKEINDKIKLVFQDAEGKIYRNLPKKFEGKKKKSWK